MLLKVGQRPLQGHLPKRLNQPLCFHRTQQQPGIGIPIPLPDVITLYARQLLGPLLDAYATMLIELAHESLDSDEHPRELLIQPIHIRVITLCKVRIAGAATATHGCCFCCSRLGTEVS
jgi:hypothetical protein